MNDFELIADRVGVCYFKSGVTWRIPPEPPVAAVTNWLRDLATGVSKTIADRYFSAAIANEQAKLKEYRGEGTGIEFVRIPGL